MLRVFYSNRTERLLSAFVADVTEFRSEMGPFEPVHVVVPNSNVETWLRFGLARSTGIAAHLDIRYLSAFVTDLSRRAGLSLVDGHWLRGLLLAVLLDDDAVSQPELGPVREYLTGAGEGDASDVRRLQLASRLSRLFEEYAFSRPEMLAQWRERCVLGNTPFAGAERWQRALWLELFGRNGRLSRRQDESGQEFVLPGELGRRLVAKPPALPRRVHVFGVSYVARVFQELFAALGRLSDLRIYTLNPCREFWEDVEHAHSRLQLSHAHASRLPRRGERLGLSALEEEDPFGLELPGDTPALRLWGRPGRENIRLLNELVDGDFDGAFDDPLADGPTLLRALQQDVLDRAEERVPHAVEGGNALRADGSIRLLACPGIRREAEIVAGEIWRLVKESEERGDPEPLRFNEIAVIVNTREKEAYFTHLTAAFAECHDIPCNVVDRSFAGTSRVGEAVALLLDLPNGNFTRAELLRLVTHPCVGGALEDADVERWAEWCEALGIAHGADREDHAGTYIEGDLFNWDQGLRRLALGAFVSGSSSGDALPVAVGGQSYLPLDVPMSSATGAARFAALVRSLVADARFARQARLTLPEWSEFLVALLNAYVAPADEDARDLARCRQLFADLAELDLDGARVSWRIASGLAKDSLARLSGKRGQHLADGVVLSTCQPMRALPFRVVFLAGLGEGKFPASERRDPLDLRLAYPRAGDVNARQQDRYLFLETLLCTREKLHLSWVSRDPLTGDPLEPSSVVSELDTMLRGYLDEAEHRKLRTDLPLRRFDPSLFPDLNDGDEAAERGPDAVPVPVPEARREAAVLALRADRSRRGSGAAEALDWESLSATLDRENREALQSLLCIPALPELPAADELPPVIEVSVPALQRFLECPLQGWARVRLGLADDDEAADAVEDEPFTSDRRMWRSFLEPLLVGALQAGQVDRDALCRRYDEANALRTLASRAPVGVFGAAERDQHLAILDGWSRALSEADVPILSGQPVRVAIGRASEHGDLNELLPTVELTDVPIVRGDEVVRRTFRLHGTLLPLVENDGERGSLVIEARGPKKPGEEIYRWRARLRGSLEHALLSAAGRTVDRHSVWTCLGGGASVATLSLGGFSEADARRWLSGLVSDLFSGVHAYLLPYEAVLQVHASGGSIAEAVEQAFREGAPSPTTLWGPVTRIDRLSPPDDNTCRRLVDRRFGPIFSRILEDDR